MRSDYSKSKLEEGAIEPDPFAQFEKWLLEARRCEIPEPEAMSLASSSLAGRITNRMVLLRGFDSTGLVFFTNYSSCKGEQLAENPNAAVCFWWWELQQQVRIEGRVERVSPAESDDYFYSRPEESRRASAASPQSQVIASREELERAAAESDGKRPVNWGGFRLAPTLFEFWQGRTARLHDRFRYRKEDGVWVIERLAP